MTSSAPRSARAAESRARRETRAAPRASPCAPRLLGVGAAVETRERAHDRGARLFEHAELVELALVGHAARGDLRRLRAARRAASSTIHDQHDAALGHAHAIAQHVVRDLAAVLHVHAPGLAPARRRACPRRRARARRRSRPRASPPRRISRASAAWRCRCTNAPCTGTNARGRVSSIMRRCSARQACPLTCSAASSRRVHTRTPLRSKASMMACTWRSRPGMMREESTTSSPGVELEHGMRARWPAGAARRGLRLASRLR